MVDTMLSGSSAITTPMAESSTHSAPPIHVACGFIKMLLLALSQAIGTHPFQQHKALMLLFLVAISGYAISLAELTLRAANNWSPMICHISGVLGCELLLFTIVPAVWWFIVINIFSVLLTISYFWHHHVYRLLNVLGKCFNRMRETCNTVEKEDGGIEMEDLEAGRTG